MQLQELVSKELCWELSDDVEFPYFTEHAMHLLRLGLEETDGKVIYALFIDDVLSSTFFEWPRRWRINRTGE